MESVDRVRMSAALYPALLAARSGGTLTRAQAVLSIKACAEGYAFPTNLDRDPPIGGLAPQSQQGLMIQALDEAWAPERFRRRPAGPRGPPASLKPRALACVTSSLAGPAARRIGVPMPARAAPCHARRERRPRRRT